MTENELERAMERYRNKRAFTRVRVNEAGQQAFGKMDGEFYLVGMVVKQYIPEDRCIHQANIGTIARTPHGYPKDINAVYLEEVD